MPFSNPKRWRIYVGYFTRLAIKWEFYVTWTKLQLHRILVCFQAWNYILAINELLIIERLGAYFIYNAFWLEEFSHKGGLGFSIPTVHKARPLWIKGRDWKSCTACRAHTGEQNPFFTYNSCLAQGCGAGFSISTVHKARPPWIKGGNRKFRKACVVHTLGNRTLDVWDFR